MIYQFFLHGFALVGVIMIALMMIGRLLNFIEGEDQVD